jgi:hypothetical protein
MTKRGRILTEDEARAVVRVWNAIAIHQLAEEKLDGNGRVSDRARQARLDAKAGGAGAGVSRANVKKVRSKRKPNP